MASLPLFLLLITSATTGAEYVIGPKQPSPSHSPFRSIEYLDGIPISSPNPPTYQTAEPSPYVTLEPSFDPYYSLEPSLEYSLEPSSDQFASLEPSLEPTQTADNLPLRTPSPDTAFGTGPLPSEDYDSLTKPSRETKGKNTIDIDNSPKVFEYDVTFNPNVITLDAIAPAVTAIACNDASVRILFNPNYPTPPIHQMFPIGGVLVINANIYGTCGNIGIQQTDDLYLRIDQVVGDSHDVTILGTPTLPFAIFEKASFSLSTPTASNATTRISQDATTLPLSVSLSEPPKISNVLEAQLKATGSITAGLEVMRAKYEDGQLDLVIDFCYELAFAYQVGLNFKAGTQKRDFESNSDGFLLFTLPVLQIVGRGLAKVPALRLGVFLEYKLVGEVAVDLFKPLLIGADNRFSCMERYRLTAQGRIISPAFLPIPLLQFKLDPLESNDCALVPGTTNQIPTEGDFEEELTRPVSASAFLGFEFSVVLSVSVFEMRVSKEVGLGAEVKGTLGTFPPLEAGQTEGVCDVCHHVQWDTSAVCRNAKFRVGLDEDVKVHRFLSFLKNVAAELPFQKGALKHIVRAGCYVAQFGEETERCGETEVCCDKSEGGCQVMEGTQPPICAASTSPSPLPFPFPTMPNANVKGGVFSTSFDLNTLSVRYSIEWNETESFSLVGLIKNESSLLLPDCDNSTKIAGVTGGEIPLIQGGKKTVTVTAPLDALPKFQDLGLGLNFRLSALTGQMIGFISGEGRYSVDLAIVETASGQIVQDELLGSPMEASVDSVYLDELFSAGLGCVPNGAVFVNEDVPSVLVIHLYLFEYRRT